MSRELRVTLADAPTDVLVRLVDSGPATTLDLLSLAPPNATDALGTVRNAAVLLSEMGLVVLRRGVGWCATSEGVAAIAKARAEAVES